MINYLPLNTKYSAVGQLVPDLLQEISIIIRSSFSSHRITHPQQMSLMLQLIGNPFSPGGEPYSHTLSGASEKCTEALSGRLGKKMYKWSRLERDHPPPPLPPGAPPVHVSGHKCKSGTAITL
jgi:hypothetical protein